MAIKIKNPDQIEKMYAAGQVVREALDRLGEIITPGITTKELDEEAKNICKLRGAVCLFYGFPGPGGPFPGNICASINEEVVHGIPSKSRVVSDGDIVSVDFGVLKDGWCGDAARTFCVGGVDPEKARLVEVTKQSLELAIEVMPTSRTWSQVAYKMQEFIRGEGFSVVEDFVGHGIGQSMHEDPQVPNFVTPSLKMRDIKLRPGIVLAVEPMVNMGVPGCRILPDGWTVVTADRKPSAHWEHTIAVVENGIRVLTA